MERAQSHERETDRQGLDLPQPCTSAVGAPCPGMGSVPHTTGPYRGWPATGGITPRAEDLRFLQLYKIHSLTEMENPIFA